LKTLVTVAVVTYQSGLYVFETLESIYNQTYQDIELIISDDCSKDNTVEIVNQWVSLEENQKRFSRIEVITVPNNTGVSANCNRCINASKSDWIKFIAGDDIFLPNCIEDNLAFAFSNPEAKVIFSQLKVFQDTFEEKNYVKTTPLEFPNNLFADSFSANDQYKLLLIGDRIHFTPSSFFYKQIFKEVSYFDESNRLVEDYPMWLKLTKAGLRLHYFHKATVGYRIHANAINNTGEVLFKPSVINGFKVRKKYAHAFLPKMLVLQETWGYYITLGFKKIGITKASSLNKFLYHTTTVYLNPFFWFNAIAKRLK